LWRRAEARDSFPPRMALCARSATAKIAPRGAAAVRASSSHPSRNRSGPLAEAVADQVRVAEVAVVLLAGEEPAEREEPAEQVAVAAGPATRAVAAEPVAILVALPVARVEIPAESPAVLSTPASTRTILTPSLAPSFLRFRIPAARISRF